jgi:hypothetical protein
VFQLEAFRNARAQQDLSFLQSTRFHSHNHQEAAMKVFRQVLSLTLLSIVSGSLLWGQTYSRKVVEVPRVNPVAMTIDGKMDEPEWATAATANVVTAQGFEMFTFPYYRPGLAEPEYEELVGRMLWAKDTLYLFLRIHEFVNDSTDLYWNGQWTGDQLFVSLSNRLGREMKGWYDGNVYAAPDGPYHFLILGDTVSLNLGKPTNIPTEYRKFPTDTTRIFNASDIARWAVTINKTTGVWTLEMAIYNPHVNAGSRIGFNIGGSTGSKVANDAFGDAYAYWTWQPSVPNSPFEQPVGVPVPEWGADPGYYNLAGSSTWALLQFGEAGGPSFVDRDPSGMPASFGLSQNYPNPFNPETFIEFAVPTQSRVRLDVYNVLGQRVATLVDAVKTPGIYQARWNASNVNSGIYFYRLTTEHGVSLTRKMMLLK